MKKYLDKIIYGVCIALAVVAILMLLAPAVVAKHGTGSYTGFELAFGVTEHDAKVLDASAAILPFLLMIAGVCLAVVAILGKGGKIVPIVAACVLVVSGVLYFMLGLLFSPHYYEFYKASGINSKSELAKQLREQFNVGYGAIVGGIFSILAGVAALVPVFVKVK